MFIPYESIMISELKMKLLKLSHYQLEEKGYDIDEIDREIFIAAGYLATVTMEVMGDLFQGAKKTKTWLADCASLITQQGHPCCMDFSYRNSCHPAVSSKATENSGHCHAVCDCGG